MTNAKVEFWFRLGDKRKLYLVQKDDDGGAFETEARCDQCKYWARDPDGSVLYGDDCEESEHRSCGRILHLYSCGPDKDARPTSVAEVPDAYVLDASGYSARLWTRPGFGCALFEQKELE